MIEHVWTVLCWRSIIDQDTKNLSLINTIEQITVKDQPKEDGVIGLLFEMVSYWVRKDMEVPDQAMARYSISSPSGNIKQISEIAIDLTKEERHRHRLRLQGIQASESGRYNIIVEVKSMTDEEWTKVTSVPLMVKFEE